MKNKLMKWFVTSKSVVANISWSVAKNVEVEVALPIYTFYEFVFTAKS